MHNTLAAKGVAQPELLDEAQKLERMVTLLPQKLRAVCAVAVALALVNRTDEADAAFVEARIIETKLEQSESINSSRRLQVRGELAQALARAGHADQALEFVRNLPGASGPRLQEFNVMRDVAIALLQIGCRAAAQKVLDVMLSKPPDRRSGWAYGYELSILAYILADFGQANEAKTILDDILRLANQAESSEDYRQRPQLLKRVASGLARIGQFSRARDVAAAIGETEEYEDAVKEIAIAFAREGRWEDARKVVAEIPVGSTQASAKNTVASVLARNGQSDVASQMLEEALALRLAVQRAQDRDSALRQVAFALAQAGRLEQARQVTREIEDDAMRNVTQSGLVWHMVQRQHFDDASETFSQLNTASSRASALAILAAGLSKVGHAEAAGAFLSQAVDLAETIDDDDELDRSSAQRAVVFALATEGSFDRAQETATKITVGWDRALAFCDIAVQMVQQRRDEEETRGMFEHSVSTAKEIPSEGVAVAILCDLVRWLVWAKRDKTAEQTLNEALDIARKIPDDGVERIRAKALAHVAACLAEIGRDEIADAIFDEALSTVEPLAWHIRREYVTDISVNLAHAGRFQRALEVAQPPNMERFVELLANWAGALDKYGRPGLSIAVLAEVTGVAGWKDVEWQRIHQLLLGVSSL